MDVGMQTWWNAGFHWLFTLLFAFMLVTCLKYLWQRRAAYCSCPKSWLFLFTCVSVVCVNGVYMVYHLMRACQRVRNFMYLSKFLCTVHGNMMHAVNVYYTLVCCLVHLDLVKCGVTTKLKGIAMIVLVLSTPFLISVCLTLDIDWYVFVLSRVPGCCVRLAMNSRSLAMLEFVVTVIPTTFVVTMNMWRISVWFSNYANSQCTHRAWVGIIACLNMNFIWIAVFKLPSTIYTQQMYFDDTSSSAIAIFSSLFMTGILKPGLKLNL